MPLTTRVSAPSFPLLDTTTLQQWLRLDAGVDAATLTMLLAGASDYLEGLIGRVLASATYSVRLDPSLPCQGFPIQPVNTVMSVVATLQDGTTQPLVSGTDYAIQRTTGEPLLVLPQPVVNAAFLTAMVAAGYQGIAQVPAALQQAAAVLVGASYDSRDALDPRTIATVSNLVQRYRAVGI